MKRQYKRFSLSKLCLRGIQGFIRVSMWTWIGLFSRIRDTVYFEKQEIGVFFRIPKTRVFSSYAKNKEIAGVSNYLGSPFPLEKRKLKYSA